MSSTDSFSDESSIGDITFSSEEPSSVDERKPSYSHHSKTRSSAPSSDFGKLSLSRLRKLVKYSNYLDDDDLFSEAEHDMRLQEPNSRTRKLSRSGKSEMKRVKEVSSDLSDDRKYKSVSNGVTRSRSKDQVPEKRVTSSKRKSNSLVLPIEVRSKKMMKKQPKTKQPSKSLAASTRSNREENNLERTIKNLERELKVLKNKTDNLEDMSFKELKSLSTTNPRLSLSSIGSKGRLSVGSKLSTSSTDEPSAIIEKKQLRSVHQRLVRLEATMVEMDSFEEKFSNMEARLSKMDQRISAEVSHREELSNKTNKALRSMETELVHSIDKHNNEFNELFNTLRLMKVAQEEDKINNDKRISSENKQLSKLQNHLESKLQQHVARMEEYSNRLDELSSQNTQLAEASTLIREQLKIVLLASNKSREMEKKRIDRKIKQEVEAENRRARRDRSNKEEKKEEREVLKNDNREERRRSQSKSNLVHASNEELYKQFHNLKKAYKRVFGSSSILLHNCYE